MKFSDLLSESDKEFRRKLLLNLESLENDARLLPVQVYDIGYLTAKASVEYNEAAKDLKRTEDHLYISIKKAFDSMKVKASEKTVETKIKTHSTYIKALEHHNNKKSEFEFIKAKKEALEVKLKMIQLAHEIVNNKMYLKRQITKQEDK